MQYLPGKQKVDLPSELDPALYLDSDEAISEYLRQILEDGDAQLLARALKDVVWAQAISQLAKNTGLPRAVVFNGLAGEAPLTTELLFKVLEQLGFRLGIQSNKAP